MTEESVKVVPVIGMIQKIALYETKARYYLVGSNNSRTRFRVIKIDRTEPRELVVIDDKIEYSDVEIKDLLLMIEMGNRPRIGPRGQPGLSRTVSAFGVLGFIKFLEGYYLILITKRRKIAVIGFHTIYKVEDTRMVYIPHDGVRLSHPDESKYVKLFHSVDLSTNFYFSYSYDLTNSLQYNATIPKGVLEVINSKKLSFPFGFGSESLSNVLHEEQKKVEHEDTSLLNEVEEAFFDPILTPDASVSEKTFTFPSKKGEGNPTKVTMTEQKVLAMKTAPCWKYVWNGYLLNEVHDLFHSDWLMYLVHGFVAQSNISVFGRPFFLTLLARRSCRYAGTRFLKRGSNFKGDVANEVETEQILQDLGSNRFTSFVQLRGSVPAHWSQDISKMVPKPPIGFDLADPFSKTAGAHFSQLMNRFGAPIVALNLVKKREKKIHESQLSEEYSSSIEYLNQFLPPRFRIKYIGFDMARINKRKDANVMARLADIAYASLESTGIYMNKDPYYLTHIRPHSYFQELISRRNGSKGLKQMGAIRVNCVDCLDRTNTAQFAIGKCALAFQLYALGILSEPSLEFDTDCVRMLEEMYEDHGDTLALQYGGSQLVHRIQTYRRTAPWTAQGQDIMHTFSRYYSNTFSDAEKQNAMNVFLGVFVPDEGRPPIWELPSDYHLHHPPEARIALPTRSLTQWWDPRLKGTLPGSLVERYKNAKALEWLSTNDIRADAYREFHQITEFVPLEDMFWFGLPHSVRTYMPNFTTEFSPFAVRLRLGKKQEEQGGIGSKNPSLSGHSSTSSVSSANSSTDSDGSSSAENGEDALESLQKSCDTQDAIISFESILPPFQQVYGMQIEGVSKKDQQIYTRFVNIGRLSGRNNRSTVKKQVQLDSDVSATSQLSKTFQLVRSSAFSLDSYREVEPPSVSKKSKDIYRQYVELGINGAMEPHAKSLKLYTMFATTMPK